MTCLTSRGSQRSIKLNKNVTAYVVSIKSLFYLELYATILFSKLIIFLRFERVRCQNYIEKANRMPDFNEHNDFKHFWILCIGFLLINTWYDIFFHLHWPLTSPWGQTRHMINLIISGIISDTKERELVFKISFKSHWLTFSRDKWPYSFEIFSKVISYEQI